MVTIIKSNDTNIIPGWYDFLDAHNDATIFQSPYISDLYDKQPGYSSQTVICGENDEPEGVLVSVKQDFIKKLPLLSRRIIWGGPLVKNPEILDNILKYYKKSNRANTLFTEIRNLFDTGASKEIFLKNGFEYIPHLNILFDLNQGIDNLWNAMSGTRRKQIQRGSRRGIKSELINLSDDNRIRECYNILAELYSKIRLPLPPNDFIHAAIELSTEKHYILCMALLYKDEIIGFRMALCFKDIIYDWYAASKEEHYDKYPNDILPWEIMKWGVENGYKVFDFGGAGNPDKNYGVRDYKMKFGGQLVEYGRYRYYHLKILKPFVKLLLKFKGKE